MLTPVYNSAFWGPQRALEGEAKDRRKRRREKHNWNRDAEVEKLSKKGRKEKKRKGSWEVDGLLGAGLVYSREDSEFFSQKPWEKKHGGLPL